MEYCNDPNYLEEKIENVSKRTWSLTDGVQRLTPIMNQEKLQSYANDILQGLSYVHSMGIIHSDMKIQNALLQRPDEEDGENGDYPMFKVCDFGLSHLMDQTGKHLGKALMAERCGTNGYIAPEVGPKNSLIGPEIDMWAFGVMLYEMCTAYKPTKLCNYRYGKYPYFLLTSIFLRFWTHSFPRSRLEEA